MSFSWKNVKALNKTKHGGEKIRLQHKGVTHPWLSSHIKTFISFKIFQSWIQLNSLDKKRTYRFYLPLVTLKWLWLMKLPLLLKVRLCNFGQAVRLLDTWVYIIGLTKCNQNNTRSKTCTVRLMSVYETQSEPCELDTGSNHVNGSQIPHIYVHEVLYPGVNTEVFYRSSQNEDVCMTSLSLWHSLAFSTSSNLNPTLNNNYKWNLAEETM